MCQKEEYAVSQEMRLSQALVLCSLDETEASCGSRTQKPGKTWSNWGEIPVRSNGPVTMSKAAFNKPADFVSASLIKG